MGSLFKSKTKTHNTPYEQNPWKPQEDYLKYGFGQAQDALTAAQKGFGQIGDFTADMTQGQMDAISGITQQGMGASQDVASMFGQAGQGLFGNLAAYGKNANDLYAQAGVDPTQSIIENAQAYADNPYVQGQIDSALGDVRKAFDGTVGDINGSATGSGNINSTRAGVLESMALDDAMDRSADISSGIRSAAYENGLNRAMSEHQQSWQNQLAANGLLGSSGMQGVGLMGQGLATGLQGFNDALSAQGMLQSQAQNEITGSIQQAMTPQDLIAQYMQTIGGSYGAHGFGTQVTQSASPFQQIMGGAATIAGLRR